MFTSKPAKDKQLHLHGKEWLVSGKTSKQIIEGLSPEGPHQNKDVAQLP
jgi:hypothetical protein